MKHHFPDEDGAWYTVAFSYSAVVEDHPDPVYEHVQRVSGRVLRQQRQSEETDTDKVGDLHLYWLQLEMSAKCGVSPYIVFENINEETEECGRLLYPSGTDRFNEDVLNQFELPLEPYRIVILNWLIIDPQLRGRDLGLFVVQRAMQVFGGPHTFVVMKPFPLQFGAIDHPWVQRRKDMEDRSGELREGVLKLSEHWKRLGFRRIGNSEWFGFNMARTVKMRSRRAPGCR